mgnify:CR=1 FL=1
MPVPEFSGSYARRAAGLHAATSRRITEVAGVNLQAMIVAVQSDHFRFRVFSGPTFFRVQVWGTYDGTPLAVIELVTEFMQEQGSAAWFLIALWWEN